MSKLTTAVVDIILDSPTPGADLDALLIEVTAATKVQKVKAKSIRTWGANQSGSSRAWTNSGQVD